ncbi:MFS transporter [Streptomyces sp. NPDC001985]|uniref:MFS transporter n=1 Tax=Streptomyces sp. NPDC001985 TaxID=3154406 RepID=UPI003324866C
MSTDAGLREERFLRAAFIVSSSGDWIFRFALPALVLQLTGSAISTALTYAVEFLPFVVIGLFSGVVADRADRRRLMIMCDVVSAVIVAGIAVLCLSDPSVVPVMAAAFLLGCVRPFSFPAFQGFLVERVAPERRAAMNAWVQGTDGTLSMLGPVAGIAVVTLLGPAVASTLNGMSFALSALLIGATAAGPAGARLRTSIGQACRSLRPDFTAGLRVITTDRGLLWATALLTLANFTFPAVAANLIFMVAGPDGRIPASLALVTAAQGLGAVLGAMAAPALLRRFEAGTLMRNAMGAMALALLLPTARADIPALTVCCFLAGAATSTFVVPWRTYRQSAVDPAFLGRVVGLQRAVPFAAIPFSALLGGWLLTEFGTSALFVTVCAVQCLVWLGTGLSPLGRASTPGPRRVRPT